MSSLAGRRVVVIDDDGEQADALALLLRMEGLKASSEVVPAAALARTISDPPDAIIVNVKMPGLAGTELLVAVRQHHPDLPALLMTGFEPHDQRLEPVLRWDRVSYLAKPVGMVEVLDALARVMGAADPRP